MTIEEAREELRQGNIVNFNYVEPSVSIEQLANLVNDPNCARYDERYAYPHGCYDNTNYFD